MPETKDDALEPGEVIAPTDSSTSQRKLGANRRNAQHSTGPRTERGKKHSRRNALKHGIYSSVLQLKEEEKEPYKKFLLRLRRDRKPFGELEEVVVEKLASDLWRNRRVFSWEARLIEESELFDVGNVLQYETESASNSRLPDPKKLDQVLRYAAAVDKQVRDSLNELERLQRARASKPNVSNDS